ncbi:MAG: zinc-ribbon domain-containing protein [Bacilli bacterium]|nr:zinc-ribbon domain-containing protein [Bacilli bacterium]
MYCKNCGTENSDSTKFCTKCGQELNKKGEGLGTASMVLGIIALVLCFIINIGTLPISLTGLILGIVNKAKKGKKISGIILNGIALVLSIIIFLIMIALGVAVFGSFVNTIENNPELKSKIKEGVETIEREAERQTSSNYVEGNYNCKEFDGSSEGDEYLVRLELDDDYHFMWGKYGETYNIYVKGTYTFKDLEKKNGSGEYSYYSININGDVYVEDGITQNKPNPQEYEFGITTKYGKKQGILMNTRSQNMYYCYEE